MISDDLGMIWGRCWDDLGDVFRMILGLFGDDLWTIFLDLGTIWVSKLLVIIAVGVHCWVNHQEFGMHNRRSARSACSACSEPIEIVNSITTRTSENVN